MTVSWSMCWSASIPATATGWVTKGSPDFRRWPSCAWKAISMAAYTSERSKSLR